ncbi:MAG: glucosaminidase domain-containing protein [Vibrio sp.]
MRNILISLFIVLIAVFGVYHFEKYTQPQKLPPLKGEAIGVAPDFSLINDIPQRKEALFGYLKPGVLYENSRILQQRAILKRIQKEFSAGQVSSEHLKQAQHLAKTYWVELPEGKIDQAWLHEMLLRVDVIPEALVLTQAANESAWGTSRFAREANNYFGQWCYRPGCGVIPLARSSGSTHEVAKFDSVQDSIRGYFMNVNRHNAYQELREIRLRLRQQKINPITDQSAYAMSHGLLKYSERREAYVQDLQAMMSSNQQYFSVN